MNSAQGRGRYAFAAREIRLIKMRQLRIRQCMPPPATVPVTVSKQAQADAKSACPVEAAPGAHAGTQPPRHDRSAPYTEPYTLAARALENAFSPSHTCHFPTGWC